MSKLTTALAVVVLLLVVAWAASSRLQNGLGPSSTITLGSPTTPSESSSLTSVSSGAQTTLSIAQTTASSVTNSKSVLPGDWLSDDPSFVGNSSKIDYPPDYGDLANYTLGLINADRASAGLTPVSLSTEPSGQQHADSLAYYGTVGHWDVQGYKPYMRYSLLGGTGYVAENVAWSHCTDSPPSETQVTLQRCTLQTVEAGLAGSEYFFMNDDVSCCNNGHRDNILDPAHNFVSLGVAYNSTTDSVYLVQDFEDSLVSSMSVQVSGDLVTLQGMTDQDMTGWSGGSSGAEIGVYYDPTPTSIPVSELTVSTSCAQYSELDEPLSCQYQGGYGAGTEVSGVLAPCPAGYACGSGNFTYAQTWQQGSGSFQIVFSIGALESTLGDGVYTLYIWPADDTTEPITSLSVFVTSG